MMASEHLVKELGPDINAPVAWVCSLGSYTPMNACVKAEWGTKLLGNAHNGKGPESRRPLTSVSGHYEGKWTWISS